VYVVWQDGRFSGKSEAVISSSTDGGATWSAPVRVSGAPGVPSFTPSVAVASDGTVGVSYFDFRSNTAAAGLPTDLWFAHCHAACTNAASWTEAHAYGPFDIEKAPVARGYFLGDYAGIATAGTDFLLLNAVAGATTNSSDIRFIRMHG
jgi:hypothetical protein